MEITKISMLLQLRDYYSFRLGQHATDYTQTASKPGHEQYFADCKRQLEVLDELITEQEGKQLCASGM
jgi:hypothetical protein